MKYKVLSFEIKQTKEGKDFKRINLKDQSGEMFNGVPYWSSLPGYEELSVGTVIEGTVTSTQNGQYTNHKLELANMPKSSPKGAFGGGMGKALMAEKGKQIEASMTRKQEAIDEAQSRNEVMWAKNGAAMLIAHHPAYANLNDANLNYALQNLTNAILNFNPRSSLTPLEKDNIQSIREVARVDEIDTVMSDDVDLPF